MADPAVAAGSANPRYEVRDARVWALVLFGFLLCLIVAFTLFGSDLIVSHFAGGQLRTSPTSTIKTSTEPPKPRLQTDPSRDLGEMRRAEDVLLHSYGWIDRQTGTVRIPIDRAIDILAAQQLGQHPQSSSSGEERTAAPER